MKIIIELDKIKVRKKSPIQYKIRVHENAIKYSRKKKHKHKD